MIRVSGALDSPHLILPAVPPAASARRGDDNRYIRLDIGILGRGWRAAIERHGSRLPAEALRALCPRFHHCPPMGVEKGGAKVERVARGFPDQRKRGRRARREAACQPVFLKSEMRAELSRQVLHADIFGQADDLDRLHAVIGGGAQDALEQLLANAATAIAVIDGERRLGVDMAPEWRLLAPDRLIGAQFGRADQLAVDEGAVDEVALAEAIFGVTREE